MKYAQDNKVDKQKSLKPVLGKVEGCRGKRLTEERKERRGSLRGSVQKKFKGFAEEAVVEKSTTSRS